ncbi:MAG: hypothetical protein DRI39_07740 [Chloroflexi bacterium]|nr:MAG: hypothetical protein DRI39_07740 [Chloroflexota bacterium]
MVLAFLIIACHSLAHGDPHYFGYNYFLVVLGWVALFLLLAACSRKTPLYGGLLSVVLSACLIVWVSRAWWLVLLYAIVMFSGLLYLIAWLEGRRAGRP